MNPKRQREVGNLNCHLQQTTNTTHPHAVGRIGRTDLLNPGNAYARPTPISRPGRFNESGMGVGLAVRDRYPTAANEPRAVYTAKDKYITRRDDVPAIECPSSPVLKIVRVSSSAVRIRKQKKKFNCGIPLKIARNLIFVFQRTSFSESSETRWPVCLKRVHKKEGQNAKKMLASRLDANLQVNY